MSVTVVEAFTSPVGGLTFTAATLTYSVTVLCGSHFDLCGSHISLAVGRTHQPSSRLEISGIASQFAIQNVRFAIHN